MQDSTSNHGSSSYEDSISEYIPTQDLPKRFPHLLSSSQVEWMMRQREFNGLDDAVVLIGKKRYIHLPSFLAWLQRDKGKI